MSPRWTMLLAAMACYLSFYTGRQNFGFAARGIQQELGLSSTQIGTITGSLLLAYGSGQVVNGYLGDRYGARLLVPLGALLSLGFNWLTSLGHSYSTILLPWIANGFAQSMGWAPINRMIANWWPRAMRGRAYGLFLLSAGSSSILTYALSIAVLQEFGWRSVFRLPVLLMIPAALIFIAFVRNRPEDLGLTPVEDHDTHTPPPASAYGEVLRNGRFRWACLSIGFESLARYGLLFWTPIHFLGPDWKRNPASVWITLALPLGMAIGAVTTGWISDRIFHGNRIRPIVIFLSLAALSTASFFAVPTGSFAAMAAVLTISGFCVYGPQSAYWALCPELVGLARAGTAIGCMDACAYFAAAAGEVIIGRSIDLTGATSAAFGVVAISCGIGALTILKARPR